MTLMDKSAVKHNMLKATQKFEWERLNLRKLNKLEVRKQYQIEITNRFGALVN